MRFVPIKSVDQQDMQALHRIRERQIKARTALVNQIRGLLAEYGVVMPKGVAQVRQKLPWALIMGPATLCFSRWTQRRRRQLHRFQYCCEHRARPLTEKPLRGRRPVRPGEEKVVNGGEALALARQIEAS
jgi:hypothetical protein